MTDPSRILVHYEPTPLERCAVGIADGLTPCGARFPGESRYVSDDLAEVTCEACRRAPFFLDPERMVTPRNARRGDECDDLTDRHAFDWCSRPDAVLRALGDE